MLLNFDHLKTFYSAIKHKMKNFRGNWEQNDPTADDYIKNRPFYSETSALEEIVKQTTLDFTNADTVDWNQPKEGYIFEYELDFPIEDGVGYTVTVDGKSYIVTAFYEQTYNNLIVGNGAFVGSNNEDNGLPFAIGKYDAEETKAYVIVPNNKCYVFSINKGSEVVHKIDKKYLPDDIGAGNLAEVAKTGSYYDLVDAPEVYPDVVRYNNTQDLTEVQKASARYNIGAGTSNFSGSYNDLIDIPTDTMLYSSLIWSQNGTEDICFGNGRFVAASSTRRMCYSDDGLHWSKCSLYDSWRTLCYGEDKFVAMRIASRYLQISYSTDGETWIERNNVLEFSSDISSVAMCYGNNKFVGTLLGTSRTGYIIYSVDGINWSTHSIVIDDQWKSICYGNGKFVMFGNRYILCSEDGLTWTIVYEPQDNILADYDRIYYINNAFVITIPYNIASPRKVLYSEDGVTWQKKDWPIRGPVIYAQDKIIGLGYDSLGLVYSLDGIVWNNCSSVSNDSLRYIQYMVYGNGMLLAVSFDEMPYFISTDGIIWMNQVLTTTDKGNVTDQIAAIIASYTGEPGYTPVRGTDYWTDADKAEIKAYIDDAILNGEW